MLDNFFTINTHWLNHNLNSRTQTLTTDIIPIILLLFVGFLVGLFFGRSRVAPPMSSTETPPNDGASFLQLIDGIDAGVLVVDDHGSIEHINRSAQQMLGGARLGPGDSIESTKAGMLMMTSSTDATQGVEIKVEPERLVQVRITKRPSGGAVFVMHDITEIKHLEVMRSDFVANVSHELRTPVSVIRANAETLLDGALDDPAVAQDFVAAIHRNSERLSNLVSDLLDLARLEAGTGSLVMMEVDLSELISRTVHSVQAIAEKKNVTIHNEIVENVFCMGDEGAIEQILINLIENAVKYGNDNGNVWGRGYQTPGRVRIEVIDDGPGIPAPHRTRLFERFYRVDKGRSRASGGTGLGLSIVKHLVTSMNGQVGIEPNRPSGSVFWVSVLASPSDPEFLPPA